MEEFTKQLSKIEVTGTKSPKKQKVTNKEQEIYNLDLFYKEMSLLSKHLSNTEKKIVIKFCPKYKS